MSRFWFILTLTALMVLTGCQFDSPAPTIEGTPRPTNPTPTAPLVPINPTVILEPTPAVVELRVWGPLELSPQGTTETASVFEAQRQAFESQRADILLAFEPKEESGAAAMMEYLRSASAVAPAILPDVIIFPTGQLDELAESQLLVPLDTLIAPAIRADLYPFALRDTQINGNWLAIPLTLQIEHGVRRTDMTRTLPMELAGLDQNNAPRWLFMGQGYGDGEISNALLLQFTAIDQTMPTPNGLPETERLIEMLEQFQAATERGTIPRTVLSLNDESELYRRLENRQADWIESNSRAFLTAQAENSRLIFAPLPTLDGETATIAEGYVIAITATNPRRQEAAALWIEWLLEPSRLADWNRLSYGLPASREGVAQTIESAPYQVFVDGLMEHAWIRPGNAAWRNFAQTIQEQFRAVLQAQITPAEFVEAIEQQ
jgi:ABC-type glycerol-3-phosphate transport system substrate-binding protein